MLSVNHNRVPIILWPFWAVWRLLSFIVELIGRILAVVLGILLIAAGVTACLTIIGLIVSIPFIVLGILLVIRGLF
jgi:hypothetical protein